MDDFDAGIAQAGGGQRGLNLILLADEETAGIACIALSSQRSAKANAVLRNALSAARGKAR